MAREVTEICINEHGDETHESWVVIRANRAQVMHGGGRGMWLFGSDISHQHVVTMEVARCSRRRQINHDYLHSEEVLLKLVMSQAQWGAFVSSFGDGTGVPATMEWLTGVGQVPAAPPESRFDESHEEVRQAGDRALEKISTAMKEVEEAFESGGRRVLREKLRTLHYAIENAPANMSFAAESLTEHVEKVIAGARADIEAMALAAVEHEELTTRALPRLSPGEES
jgi:hypothetical protein